jgi:hypothetical protein
MKDLCCLGYGHWTETVEMDSSLEQHVIPKELQRLRQLDSLVMYPRTDEST